MALQPSVHESNAVAVSTGITGVEARKVGNTVTLYINPGASTNVTADAWHTIGTLPSELRPYKTLDAIIINNVNTLANFPMQLEIVQSTGVMRVYVFSSQATKINPMGVISYQTS